MNSRRFAVLHGRQRRPSNAKQCSLDSLSSLLVPLPSSAPHLELQKRAEWNSAATPCPIKVMEQAWLAIRALQVASLGFHSQLLPIAASHTYRSGHFSVLYTCFKPVFLCVSQVGPLAWIPALTSLFTEINSHASASCPINEQ